MSNRRLGSWRARSPFCSGSCLCPAVLRRRLLWSLALAAATTCTPSGIDGGRCVQDSDCNAANNETCVFDLTRNASYCSHLCDVDSDCAESQTCRTGVDVPES